MRTNAKALCEARELGKQYADWDSEMLVQSAEYANDILPALRALAGYVDAGYGTYSEIPDGENEDAIISALDELLDTFEEAQIQK